MSSDTVRHILATLAYRLQTAVRGAPSDFGDFDAGHGVRTPAQIVRHMTHVLKSAHRRLEASADVQSPSELSFDDEISRFHEMLAVLDRELVEYSKKDRDDILLTIVQGPLADALTHVGQIAMLRRMAGSSVRGQNFAAADVETGHVGTDQSAPRRPFEK